jgi:hypothetical protein
MICLLVASLAANAGALRDAHAFDEAGPCEDVAVAPTARPSRSSTRVGQLWVVRTDT